MSFRQERHLRCGAPAERRLRRRRSRSTAGGVYISVGGAREPPSALRAHTAQTHRTNVRYIALRSRDRLLSEGPLIHILLFITCPGPVNLTSCDVSTSHPTLQEPAMKTPQKYNCFFFLPQNLLFPNTSFLFLRTQPGSWVFDMQE